MSLHYILDGYNVLHQIPQLAAVEVQKQRSELVRFIQTDSPQGSFKNKVTIVFDGYCSQGFVSSAVEVIFSQDKSADEKIKSIVAHAQNKKNIIVVTDDREIQYAVRAHAAEVCCVKDFLSRLQLGGNEGKQRKTTKDNQQSVKNISKTLEFEINEELKKIWLKKKE